MKCHDLSNVNNSAKKGNKYGKILIIIASGQGIYLVLLLICMFEFFNNNKSMMSLAKKFSLPNSSENVSRVSRMCPVYRRAMTYTAGVQMHECAGRPWLFTGQDGDATWGGGWLHACRCD